MIQAMVSNVESDEHRDVFAMRLEIVDELVGDLLESRRRGQLVHLGAVLSEGSHPMLIALPFSRRAETKNYLHIFPVE